MGDKKKKIINTVIDGATDGLPVDALFAYIKEKHPKASSKKIVRASFLALSDPDLRDRNILNTIYGMAIKHRLDNAHEPDHDNDEDDDDAGQPGSVEAAVLPPAARDTKPAKGRRGKADNQNK